MAVFTKLDQAQIEAVLAQYEVGELLAVEPVIGGIENTNYFVTTRWNGAVQSWVLTLFENVNAEELPYFTALTRYLAERQFAVPAPLKTRAGDDGFVTRGRHGVLVPRFPGRSETIPSLSHCAALGSWLGQMHCALAPFPLHRRSSRDQYWYHEAAGSVMAFLDLPHRQQLTQFLRVLDALSTTVHACPQGTIHGDLFRDNVLFDGVRISGVIDFYHGSFGPTVFDLAIALNDWCFDRETGAFDPARELAMVQGYRQSRVLSGQEQAALGAARRLAACQFWLSRMQTLHGQGYQRAVVLGDVLKDPEEMAAMLAGLSGS
jgi:homoserine kinase type II